MRSTNVGASRFADDQRRLPGEVAEPDFRAREAALNAPRAEGDGRSWTVLTAGHRSGSTAGIWPIERSRGLGWPSLSRSLSSRGVSPRSTIRQRPTPGATTASELGIRERTGHFHFAVTQYFDLVMLRRRLIFPLLSLSPATAGRTFRSRRHQRRRDLSGHREARRNQPKSSSGRREKETCLQPPPLR